MQTIDNIYYINLARRQDRKTHFLSQCAKHNIDQSRLERFEAFDGRNHQFPQSTLQLFRNADYLQYPYRSAVICNQMSHFTILKQMIEKNQKFILVFPINFKIQISPHIVSLMFSSICSIILFPYFCQPN